MSLSFAKHMLLKKTLVSFSCSGSPIKNEQGNDGMFGLSFWDHIHVHVHVYITSRRISSWGEPPVPPPLDRSLYVSRLSL